MRHYKTYSILGELTVKEFLTAYWQKKPLLVRNAIPNFSDPLSPDELAGLACDESVESRIILEKDGSHPWELRFGPFDNASFAQLPATHWTLLVQECNKHLLELALLLDKFTFIPNWRMDDVMVSYAAPQGSVGPHQDQYDVFLIQGLGHRHWQISTQTNNSENLVPGTDLRILEHFKTEQEWVLAPGDMLYLPPGVAHYGIAQDHCMTYSVGFRAPSHYDIVTAFTESQFDTLRDSVEQYRYTDPALSDQISSGLISDATLQQIKTIIGFYTANEEQISHWFARYASEPKNEVDLILPTIPLNAANLPAAIKTNGELLRSEYARFVYVDHGNKTKSLFINGNEYRLNANLAFAAPLICGQRLFSYDLLQIHFENPEFLDLLTELFNQGFLYLQELQ